MSKERKARRLALEMRLANLEGLISSNTSHNLFEEYSKCKSDLESLYNYITAGIILRLKSKWYEHGEKSSKYFLNLEKRNKAKSHISKLLISSDVEISTPPDITNHIKEFYASLYKQRSAKTEQDCLEYLHNINIPQSSQSERESCEGLLTKRECWKALCSMKNKRTNSLINVDTKIASKVLAMRMKNILTSIISHDETPYVKGRYIGKSISLISDILEYNEDSTMGAILFSADLKKAFNSVEHMFIISTLQSFGFGPQFSQSVRTIFQNAESCVMNNGISRGYFPLERGK